MTHTVILVVDDEKTVLDSLSEQLRRLFGDGVECEAAESADEALDVLAQLHAEDARVLVVVSDWLMPGLRGDAFLAEVRARYPGVGRILLTGQADPAVLERARVDGNVHRILFKPWRPDDLCEAVRQSMGASE